MVKPYRVRKAKLRVRDKVALVIFCGALFLLAAWALTAYGAKVIDRWTATAATRHAWMWIDTPDVEPGGTIHLRIRTDGELQSRIDHVAVRVGESVVDVQGRKADWGPLMYGRKSTEDVLALDVPVPATARAGDRLPVEVALDFVYAHRVGRKTFDNVPMSDRLAAFVEIRSPSGLRWRRALSGGWAVLVLAFSAAVPATIARRRKARPPEPGVGIDGGSLLQLAILVAFVIAGALGHVLFARPLMRALGSFDPTLATLFPLVWVVTPMIAFAIAHLTTPPSPQRIFVRAVLGPVGSPHRPPNAQGSATASRAADSRPLAAIAAALEAAGLRVKRRRRHLTIASGGPTGVRITNEDPDRVTPEGMVLEAVDLESAINVVTVLAGVFGPVEVSTLRDAACVIEPPDVAVVGR